MRSAATAFISISSSRLTQFYPIRSLAKTICSTAARHRQIREMDGRIKPPYMAQAGVRVERQLPKNLVLAVNYLRSRGWITSLARHYTDWKRRGPDVTTIYLYESTGNFKQDQLVNSLTARVNPEYLV